MSDVDQATIANDKNIYFSTLNYTKVLKPTFHILQSRVITRHRTRADLIICVRKETAIKLFKILSIFRFISL